MYELTMDELFLVEGGCEWCKVGGALCIIGGVCMFIGSLGTASSMAVPLASLGMGLISGTGGFLAKH